MYDPIKYQPSRHLDYLNERAILQRKMADMGYQLIHRADNETEGRYELKKDDKKVTLFIRTCLEHNRNGTETFWFGMKENLIHEYPFLALVMIMVWPNGRRVYLCLSNWKYRDLLPHFYSKNGVNSIDIIKVNARYFLTGKNGKREISLWENKFDVLLQQNEDLYG